MERGKVKSMKERREGNKGFNGRFFGERVHDAETAVCPDDQYEFADFHDDDNFS